MPTSDALVNPELLVWARRTAGFPVEEAVRRLHVSTDRLRAWERGESSPTFGKLRDLAHLYKRPLAAFYLEQAPPEDPLLPDFRRRDGVCLRRCHRSFDSPFGRPVYACAEALELYEDLGEQPSAFQLSARSNEDPETVGNRLRKALTATDEPPIGDSRIFFNYWRNAAEANGVLVFQAEHVPPDEMSAFSLSDRPLPAVVLNIKEAYAARSFSLCHELTHIMLGEPGLCNMHENGSKHGQRNVEVFCNHVAGAVLMPASEMLRSPKPPPRWPLPSLTTAPSHWRSDSA